MAESFDDITREYILRPRKGEVLMNHEITVGPTNILLKSSMSSFGLKDDEVPALDGYLKLINDDFQVSVNVQYYGVKPAEVSKLTSEEKIAILDTISYTDYICREEQEFKLTITNKRILKAIESLHRAALDAVPNLLKLYKTLNTN